MIDTAILKQKLGELDEAGVDELLGQFLDGNPTPEEVQRVVEACQQGMEIVGDNFEAGVYFVGDLMYAAQILTDALDRLKPLMSADAGSKTVGTLVLCTVAGDIHDIGKNIYKALSEAAGFTVVDVGIDRKPEAFVEAAQSSGADIVGLSGVLTLSIASMKDTIEALKAAGLRDKVKVMIGGNAVSEEACRYVGADYWSKNAATSVKKGLEYLA